MCRCLSMLTLCASVVSCAFAAVPESVAGYTMVVDFYQAQSTSSDIYKEARGPWAETPMSPLRLEFPADGGNEYTAKHPHNTPQYSYPDVKVSYSADASENKAYVKLGNQDFEALVVLSFSDAESGTGIAFLHDNGATTHYRHLTFRIGKDWESVEPLQMPEPDETDGDPDIWDDGLTAMLEELKVADYQSAIHQLYRRRLLTLLPLIQVNRNADTTLPETKGNTALHYACGLSHVPLVEWLITHGANLEARTDKGATIDDCIGGKNAKKIKELLRQARKDRDNNVPLFVTDETQAIAAALWLENAFSCKDIDSVAYVIPVPDEEAKLAAETLCHFVVSQQRLPHSVRELYHIGPFCTWALEARLTPVQFEHRLLGELQQARENKLDALLEAASYFADVLLTIPDVSDDVTEVVVTFHPNANTPPDVRVERRKVKTTMLPYTLKLHFCGRVSTQEGAEASLLLGSEYADVAIAEPESRFDADIARHFGKHCRLVSYLYQSHSLDIYYTPDGEIDVSRTPAQQVPQSSLVFPIRFCVAPR